MTQAADKKTAVSDDKAKDGDAVAAVPEVSAEALALADIAANVALVKKSVAQAESRFCMRVLRALPWLRKKLDAGILGQAIRKHFPKGATAHAAAGAA